MESKVGTPSSEIAKHKLVYPIEAVAPLVPKDFEIIPIYMKIQKDKDDLIFHIAICELPDVRTQKVFISDLKVMKSRSLRIRSFGNKNQP